MTALFTLKRGSSRLVVSIPHAGIFLPADVAARLNDTGRRMDDTDWHVDQLYGFLHALDATVLIATHSRFVVDLNRGPCGTKLYPGQAETGICPTESFAGAPLYDGPPPDGEERRLRVARYWQPYHDALAEALARVRAEHGVVHLLDAHSIAREVPRLFAGRLPDLNIGTYDGASADGALATRIMRATEGSGFSIVLNGRFKGGYITRHYGDPACSIHAVQLEIAQSAYLDERAPRIFSASRAAPLTATLERIVGDLLRA